MNGRTNFNGRCWTLQRGCANIFPVFAHFRGGKGVATLFGMILAACSIAIVWSVFLLVLSYPVRFRRSIWQRFFANLYFGYGTMMLFYIESSL